MVLGLLITAFILGPLPDNPEYFDNWPPVPVQLSQLEEYVANREDSLPLRKDNNARIIWANGQAVKTEYAIVYLHGFAGSYRDGYPVNVATAHAFGCNIYLARWAGHGLKPPASLNNFTAKNAWQSAKEALAIGRKLGKKVILMSTSTGGTLSIMLAAHFPDSVYAMINMSPNIKDDQFGSFMLDSPWGYELAHLVSLGQQREVQHDSPGARHYWDTIYPAEALIELQVLVASTMEDKTFEQIKVPALTLCYHVDYFTEDERVEIDAMRKAHAKFNTPRALKKLVCLAEPGTHFIGSALKSDNYQVVQEEIIQFCQQKLNMQLKANSGLSNYPKIKASK